MLENNKRNSVAVNSTVSISEEFEDDKNIIFNGSDSEIRSFVWGPYYWMTLFTLQLCPKLESKALNAITWFPAVIFMIIYFIRKIYLLVQMAGAIMLSSNFAYTTIFFFSALHSFIASMTLATFKKVNYHQITVEKLKHSSRNKIRKCSIIEFLIQLIVIVLIMGPAILSVIENYVMFDQDLTDLRNRDPPVPSNETATFRSSMFGGKFLYFIDGIIIIWGAFLSTSALLTYLLANRAICRQYDYFNQKLKKHIECGSIKNFTIMKSFENQLIDLLQTAAFITNNASILIDLTFICGLYFHITSQFALRAFQHSFQTVQLALFALWFGQSFLMIVLSLGRPSALRSLMKETNEMLLLEQRIWNDDAGIREIANNMSYKIQNTDYASKGMTPIKAGAISVTLIFLLTPFLVNILANFKYVPSYQQ